MSERNAVLNQLLSQYYDLDEFVEQHLDVVANNEESEKVLNDMKLCLKQFHDLMFELESKSRGE
jgi:AICAR transformylase/IMP cyclohydrolase PurH